MRVAIAGAGLYSHAPTSVENARASAGFCQERTIDWPSWDDRLVPIQVIPRA